MNIIDNFKGVVRVVQQADNIELYRQILDLQSDALALVEENQSLKKQVADLERKWEIQEDLQFRDHAYWRSSGEGPFCVSCWDGKRMLMRMTGEGNVVCHSCKYNFYTKEYTAEIKARMSRGGGGWG